MGMKKFGEKIFGSKIDITDPGYEKDVWCRINDVQIEPGNYSCYYSLLKKENRIRSIKIIHNDYLTKVCRTEYLDIIGVDAGMAGFFENKPDFKEENEWMNFCNKVFEELDNTHLDVHLCEYGFFSGSGYGDGTYPVFLLKDINCKVIGVTIIFIN